MNSMKYMKALLIGALVTACFTVAAAAERPGAVMPSNNSPAMLTSQSAGTAILERALPFTQAAAPIQKEGWFTAIPTEVEVSPERRGAALVSLAMEYVGVRYVYGGMSPRGFDCSGFVTYIYNQFGYDIRRTATQLYRFGSDVSKAELQPGDMVFFSEGYGSRSIGHVGIYIGDGNFVHASSGKGRVIVSSLSDDYYGPCYYGARTLIYA